MSVMMRGGRAIALGKLFMGGLTNAQQFEIFGEVNAVLETNLTALLNAARRGGADSALIARLEREWDELGSAVLDLSGRAGDLEEAEARVEANRLLERARQLIHQAEELAGSRNLSGPVLWGAGVIAIASAITYLVWKHRQKVKRRRYR